MMNNSKFSSYLLYYILIIFFICKVIIATENYTNNEDYENQQIQHEEHIEIYNQDNTNINRNQNDTNDEDDITLENDDNEENDDEQKRSNKDYLDKNFNDDNISDNDNDDNNDDDEDNLDDNKDSFQRKYYDLPLKRQFDTNRIDPNNKKENFKTKYKMIKSILFDDPDFVGTNLDFFEKICLPHQQFIMLLYRNLFEHRMLPKEEVPKCLLNNRYIEKVIHYFHRAHSAFWEILPCGERELVEKSFYDAVGGYVNHFLLPLTKYSFYAGTVYNVQANAVVMLHKKVKEFLNTNGNGWRPPINDFSEFDLSMLLPINLTFFSENDHFSTPPCINLELKNDNFDINDDDDDMIVSLPKLYINDGINDENNLSNVWLPIKIQNVFDLRVDSSAHILMQYFIAVSRCYNFQGICQEKFNKKFQKWIEKEILCHLNDTTFYPGLGAILRVLETLRDKNAFKRSKHKSDENEKENNGNYSQPFKKLEEFASVAMQGESLKAKAQLEANIKSEDLNKKCGDDGSECTDLKTERKFIIYIIILILLLLIIVLLVALLRRCMKDGKLKFKKKKDDTDKENKDKKVKFLNVNWKKLKRGKGHDSESTNLDDDEAYSVKNDSPAVIPPVNDQNSSALTFKNDKSSSQHEPLTRTTSSPSASSKPQPKSRFRRKSAGQDMLTSSRESSPKSRDRENAKLTKSTIIDVGFSDPESDNKNDGNVKRIDKYKIKSKPALLPSKMKTQFLKIVTINDKIDISKKKFSISKKKKNLVNGKNELQLFAATDNNNKREFSPRTDESSGYAKKIYATTTSWETLENTTLQ